MHDKQIGFDSDGKSHRRKAGVHRGGDARNATGVFNLKPVHRAVVIADFAGAEQLIAVFDDGRERGVWHGGMKTGLPVRGKLEVVWQRET